MGRGSHSLKPPIFRVMPDTSWLRYFLAQEDSDIDGWLLPIFIVWIQTLFILRYSILKILKGLSEFCDELFLLVYENWIQIDSPYMKWKSLNVLNQSSPGDRERLKNTKAAATLLIWSFVPHYIICPRVCWTKSVCTAVLPFSFNPSLFWILAQALLNSCGYHR